MDLETVLNFVFEAENDEIKTASKSTPPQKKRTQPQNTILNMNYKIDNPNDPLWDEIYKANYDFFRKYFERKFSYTKETIEDAYHDAFEVFFEDVQKEDFDITLAKIKWYLITTASYKLLNRYRRSQKMHQIQQQLDVNHKQSVYDQQEVAYASQRLTNERAVVYLLSELGCTVKALIELRYFREYCHEAIAREMNYQSAAVSKSQLSRILKKIRQDKELLAKLRLMLY